LDIGYKIDQWLVDVTPRAAGEYDPIPTPLLGFNDNSIAVPDYGDDRKGEIGTRA
jgi:hypothetical protein